MTPALGATLATTQGVVDGSGRWQISSAGGRQPVWNPAGTRVYFLEISVPAVLVHVDIDLEGDSPVIGRPVEQARVPV